PWVDVDLWEFWIGLPASSKFPELGPKAHVRRLLRSRVPDLILDRSEKTVFNEYMIDQIDYQALAKWLVAPPERIRGVDYDLLADQLARRDLNLPEFLWVMELATIHAFLDQW
ncbi:MAG TPA: asparagine synthase-related protein, partial [Acidimicrobiia bacterium]